MLAILLFIGTALLAGCSGSSVPTIQTQTIDLQVGAGANEDNAIAVDLVLVFDIALVPQVEGIDAATWFRTKDQIQLANPTGFEVQSYEVIPSQPGLTIQVGSTGSNAVGAFLFASYITPGPHRTRIDTMPQVLVRLGAMDFKVSPLPT